MKNKKMNEVLKRHFEVKSIKDEQTDKAGADETEKARTVVMETVDGRKITLKGGQDQITGFVSGENVEVRITRTQTELFEEEEEIEE